MSNKVMQLITSSWINYPLYVVVKLEIPDLLSDKTLPIEELARISHSPYLYRVIRALSSLNFFREHDKREFSLTPLGELL